jgi:hypothetical protein
MRLHPELVAILREIKGENEPEALVFKRFPRIERFKRDLKNAGIPYQDALGRYADFHALRTTLCTNLAKAGVPRRTAMAVMRHSDGKLTDKTYMDENLLGTETAIDVLPAFTETLSQGASQRFGTTGQNVSLPVTTSCGPEVAQTLVNQGVCHSLALPVTMGQKAGNGGSGGARTRNLCRDRAAL